MKSATQVNSEKATLPTAPIKIVTTQQLAEMIPAYEGRPGAIRWQVFNSSTNGLKESGAIIRNGRRVLIDVDKYFTWVESRTSNTVAEASQ